MSDNNDQNEGFISPLNQERIRAYKNNALDQNELRRRREEEGIQLRKQKRDDLLRKRRNLNCGMDSDISVNVNSVFGLNPGNIDGGDIQNPTISSNTATVTPFNAEMISGLYLAGNKGEWLISTRAVRHVLSKSTAAPITEVINSGIVPRLVEFLDHSEDHELQFEATWCLTNISSGNAQQTRTVVEAGAVPKLLKLLDSTSHLVREQAVWAMGNIAGNGPTERDFLLRVECVDPLIKLADNEDATPQMLRNISWCIVNLVRYKNPPAPFDVLSCFIPCLAKLLNLTDPDVLVDVSWAFAHLANGSNEQIQKVLDADVCARLVQLLLHQQIDVSVGALRAVGNLVTGDDQQTQIVLNSGVLPCLRVLLESGHPCCHKEVCWTLSNITAGNSSQVQQIMEAGLFSVLVKMMSHSDFKLRKEAAWSIINACLGGYPIHIQALVGDGCIPPLCKLLSVDDVPVVSMAISGIEAILRKGEQHAKQSNSENKFALKVEECGGLDRIEFLQMHQSVEIYKRAYHIIDQYFGQEEIDSTVSLTPVESDHFEFTPNTTASTFEF